MWGPDHAPSLRWEAVHNPVLEAIQDRVSTLIPSWNPERICAIEPLRRGLSNQNFAFCYEETQYVLRIGREGFDANPAESEAWLSLSQYLPRLIACNWQTGDLLTERIAAPCLAETSKTPDELTTYLTRLHQIMPERLCVSYQLDAFISEKVKELRGHRVLPGSIDQRVRRLRPMGCVEEACHNDLNAWNILVSHGDPKAWVTLDWEWAGNFTRLFDAVNLSLFYGLNTLQAHEVADGCGYLDESRYGPFELVVERYWLREYCFAAGEVAAGRDSEYVQEQLQTCLRALADLD